MSVRFGLSGKNTILEAQYHDMITGKYAPTARQFYTGNASLAAKWLRRAGGFDESFKRAEDIELVYRLEDMGLRFHFNPQAIGYHYPTALINFVEKSSLSLWSL